MTSFYFYISVQNSCSELSFENRKKNLTCKWQVSHNRRLKQKFTIAHSLGRSRPYSTETLNVQLEDGKISVKKGMASTSSRARRESKLGHCLLSGSNSSMQHCPTGHQAYFGAPAMESPTTKPPSKHFLGQDFSGTVALLLPQKPAGSGERGRGMEKGAGGKHCLQSSVACRWEAA